MCISTMYIPTGLCVYIYTCMVSGLLHCFVCVDDSASRAASVAQFVQYLPRTQCVMGSHPTQQGSSSKITYCFKCHVLTCTMGRLMGGFLIRTFALLCGFSRVSHKRCRPQPAVSEAGLALPVASRERCPFALGGGR